MQVGGSQQNPGRNLCKGCSIRAVAAVGIKVDRSRIQLSSTAANLTDLPAETIRRLPRYPLVPAILLGRLAVDIRYRGKGYGRFLLADALRRAVRSEIASFAVVVEAKDEAALRFYERESFLPFPETPSRLFRPMADIAKLFA